MNNPLGALKVQRKSGAEQLIDGEALLDVNLLAFWQWSCSDLVDNVTRGALAEFIVALALGVDITGNRDSWSAFDLTTPEGITVEVKSSAYVQTWFQNRLSKICFNAGPTRYWDPATNRLDHEPKRQANVYVFAVLREESKESVNPLNVSQWDFYVVPTPVLDAGAGKTSNLSLALVRKLAPSPVRFAELGRAVAEAGGFGKKL